MTNTGLEGVCSCASATSKAPMRNPPIRNLRNPWVLARQKPDGLQWPNLCSGLLCRCWTASAA
eukprot:12873825-Alexandrium_andersonii.AAC.1